MTTYNQPAEGFYKRPLILELNPEFTSPHSQVYIYFPPEAGQINRIWKEPSSSRGRSRRWLMVLPSPLLPHSTPLPWLKGDRWLQASATCFFTVSSVTASENSAATCFFPFFIGRAGPGSAGRFPFIASRCTNPRSGKSGSYFPPETTVPEMPHSLVPVSPNGKAPKNKKAWSIHN